MNINKEWQDVLQEEFNKDYYKELITFLGDEYNNYTIYPKKEDVFNAYNFTPYSKVKVVIVGQDPYHEPNQAHGLAFSVQKGIKVPPSLVNIYKELNNDINFKIPSHGNLEEWSKEGVLLINSVLTVRKGEANSHKNKGWEKFTDAVIKALDKSENPIVFVLWGNNAKKLKKNIKNKNHLILEGVHPSPLSAYRGFFESHFFSTINDFLEEPINWSITE